MTLVHVYPESQLLVVKPKKKEIVYNIYEKH